MSGSEDWKACEMQGRRMLRLKNRRTRKIHCIDLTFRTVDFQLTTSMGLTSLFSFIYLKLFS